MFMYNIRLVQL